MRLSLLEQAIRAQSPLCVIGKNDPLAKRVSASASVEERSADYRRLTDLVRLWIRSGLCPRCGGIHVLGDIVADEAES